MVHLYVAFCFLMLSSICSCHEDFDVNPPVPVTSSDESSFSSSDEGSLGTTGSTQKRSRFVDETIVSRWRVPEGYDTVFARITAENHERKKRARPATEAVSRDSTTTTETLTVSAYRKQQSEWLRKTTAEQLSKKKKHSKAVELQKESDSVKDSPTGEKNSHDPAIVCDLTRPVDSSLRQVELKIVEVLNYTSAFMRAMNVGDFEGLNNLMLRTVVPECVFKLYFAPNTFPSKIIPRDSISYYFRVLNDAIPDALWKIEDTRLRQGKPRTVISTFTRSGAVGQC